MGARSDLLAERVARHGLAGRPCATPAAAATITTALQAQDNQASRFGIRARSATLRESDVRHAIDDERTVVRTWLLRGTIHLVATTDLRWLVGLLGPAIARKYRTRWRQLGLSDGVLDRMVNALPAVLAGGPRTRREIRAALVEHGVHLDSTDPQVTSHAVLHASTTGLICRGPDRGRDATFVMLDRWVPDSPIGPSGGDALAELARRYFAAYSPATPADFATWSGLPARSALDLIRDELTCADVDGSPGYRLGVVEPAAGTRLLPAFDNYLLGYRDRAAILAGPHYGRVYDGGIIRPTVLRHGRVVGTWALNRTSGIVAVTPFAALPTAAVHEVEGEVADIGRFVECELTLDLHVPLG